MSIEKELDFPVFAVNGDPELEMEVEQAAELKLAIGQLSEYIVDLDKTLKEVGTKLNFYMNNVIKRNKPFDYTKHIVLFNDDNEASIYTQEFVEQFMEENDLDEEEDLFGLLPPTDDIHPMNKKQAERCLELIDKYNEAIITWQYCLYEFNEYSEWYTEIVLCIKEELSSVKMMEIRNEDKFELEIFDDEIHELIMTQDSETKKWQFVYIRKENKEKFYDFCKTKSN